MAIDLTSIKREAGLLAEKPIKGTPGRKKLANEAKRRSQKVVTYLTEGEKNFLETLADASGVCIAEYARAILRNHMQARAKMSINSAKKSQTTYNAPDAQNDEDDQRDEND